MDAKHHHYWLKIQIKVLLSSRCLTLDYTRSHHDWTHKLGQKVLVQRLKRQHVAGTGAGYGTTGGGAGYGSTGAGYGQTGTGAGAGYGNTGTGQRSTTGEKVASYVPGTEEHQDKRHGELVFLRVGLFKAGKKPVDIVTDLFWGSGSRTADCQSAYTTELHGLKAHLEEEKKRTMLSSNCLIFLT